MRTSSGLARAVSRWQVIAISINGVVGSGVYLVPAAAAALMGAASLWAVPLAGLAVLLLALCFAEAGSRFDEPGGGYIYTRAAFGEFIGFQVGWMTWLARIASGAALWSGLAQALTFILPGAGEGLTRVAVITVPLILLTVINVVGVSHAARLEVAFTVAKLLPLLFLIGVGIPAVDGSLIIPMPAFDPAGLGAAAGLLLFAYAGFENTAAAAGEFKNPQLDVPFALIVSTVAITLLYTLVQLVALGTLPDLAARVDGAPLADAATLIVGVWAGVFLTLGAVVSIGGNIGSHDAGRSPLSVRDGDERVRAGISRADSSPFPNAVLVDRGAIRSYRRTRAVGLVCAAGDVVDRRSTCHLHRNRSSRTCIAPQVSGQMNAPSCSRAARRFPYSHSSFVSLFWQAPGWRISSPASSHCWRAERSTCSGATPESGRLMVAQPLS